MVGIESFIDAQRAPKYLNVKGLISNALFHPGYDTLADFHRKSMLIGMMHFQDKSNYMVERTERCCIHYAVPSGALVPFCAFNVIPEKYRDKIQREYGIPLQEWNSNNPDKIVKLYRTSEELKLKSPLSLI